MTCCGNGKSGMTARITRLETIYNNGEEEKSEVVIYEKIQAYSIRVLSNKDSDTLAEDTSHTKRIIKIGKKILIQKGDLVKLSQKGFELGTYKIEEIDPKIIRGRVKSIYLYLQKYNES